MRQGATQPNWADAMAGANTGTEDAPRRLAGSPGMTGAALGSERMA